MRASAALLTALALASAACAPPPVQSTSNGSSGGPLTPTPSASRNASMAGMTHYSANLASVGSSTVHGSATIHSMSGKQTVELQLTGAPAGATLPWHIHTGSCADGMTPIVGNAALYTAIGASGDGSASMMADVPVTLSPGQRYHVNVHASPSDMGTIVACGDLAS